MAGGRPLIEAGPEQFVRRNACDVCHKSIGSAMAIRHDPPEGERGELGLCVPCHDELILSPYRTIGEVLGEGSEPDD